MQTYYLFDVDGTLTESRKKMDPAFADAFEEWADRNVFSLVSGSDLTKIQEQVPEAILVAADKIFCCAGNNCWDYQYSAVPNESIHFSDYLPVEVYRNEIEISKALEEYLLFELKYSNWVTPRIAPHFEYRTGILNFSICGRGVSDRVRKEYEEFSKHDGDRLRICNYINEKFPDYTANIGGQISVDITLKGGGKEQVLDHIDLKTWAVMFYGDKISGNGNDFSLAKRISDLGCGFSYEVKSFKDLIRPLNLRIKNAAN